MDTQLYGKKKKSLMVAQVLQRIPNSSNVQSWMRTSLSFPIVSSIQIKPV